MIRKKGYRKLVAFFLGAREGEETVLRLLLDEIGNIIPHLRLEVCLTKAKEQDRKRNAQRIGKCRIQKCLPVAFILGLSSS